MVKVTIEHDGKTFQHEGNLFVGQISSLKGCEIEAAIQVVGNGTPQMVIKVLEGMMTKVIQELSEDPIVVCGSLIEINERIDQEIRKYMKKNIDGLTDNIREFLAGEEAWR